MSEAENFLKTSLEKIGNLIDINKTIGNPIVVEGKVIIPISEVKLCYLSGGTEYNSKQTQEFPFGGISGGNIVVRPSGFVVISDDKVEALTFKEKSIIEKIIEEIPTILNKNKK